MEPLSALGLAGNLLQFIDFGTKIISKAREIRESAAGASEINLELEALTTDLNSLCLQIKSSEEGLDTIKPTQSEKELVQLADSCNDLALDFLTLLESFKVRDRYRRLDSIRIALRVAWNQNNIAGYTERLDQYRSAIMARLTSLLSYQNEKVLKALDDLSKRHCQCQMTTMDTPTHLKRRILNMIDVWEGQTTQDQSDISQLDAAGEETSSKYAEEISKLPAYINELQEKALILDKQSRIVKSLQFPALEARHSRVVNAAAGTFQWLESYEDSQSHMKLMDWTESKDERPYWITGKPGSGKSTLMKWLHSNRSFEKGLQRWANGSLYTAIFYFWNAGTEMQNSQQGLLQSLLFHILRQCPSLIPDILPERWDNSWRRKDVWSVTELMQAFSNLRLLDSHIKFCFLIDGLDEYKGDHQFIIATINDIVRK